MQINSIFSKCLVLGAVLMTLNTHAATTDIACVFETTEHFIPEMDGHNHHQQIHQPKPSKWYFWRTDHEIEVANGERSFGEKWTKTDKQVVYYQALYHDKKFLLEFQPADLKILGQKTNWKTRSTLFPQALLKQLKPIKTGKFKQYAMASYAGAVSGVEYKVDWLPELKLPVRVEKTALNKKVITELKEIHSVKNSPYKQSMTEKYDDMDYADIGDNESHPVVSQLQRNTGVGYFHQH